MDKSCDCSKLIKKLKQENLYLKENVVYLESLINKIKNELEELKNIHHDPEIDKYFFF
jgi:hypothetical protein